MKKRTLIIVVVLTLSFKAVIFAAAPAGSGHGSSKNVARPAHVAPMTNLEKEAALSLEISRLQSEGRSDAATKMTELLSAILGHDSSAASLRYVHNKLQTDFVVELDPTGRVVRVISGTHSPSLAFNVQTYNNVMQMNITNADGVSRLRVGYRYDPTTQQVTRSVARLGPSLSSALLSSPILIKSCSVAPPGSAGSMAAGTHIIYVNDDVRTATAVTFAVGYHNGDGSYLRRVTDIGTFPPQVAIDHTYSLYNDVTFAGTQVTSCVPVEIKWVDGTVWMPH
jgi:hypothetical protein